MDFKIVIVLFCNFICCLGFAGDPYKILGVSRRATQTEIKKAYKILAKKWHPDRSDSADAQARFMKIVDAYQVLTDAQKKENYDRYGTEDHPIYQNRRASAGQYHFRSAEGMRFTFQGDPFEHFHQEFFRRHRYHDDKPVLSQRIWNKIKSLPWATLEFFGLEEGLSWTTALLAVGAVVGCGLAIRFLDVDRSQEAAESEARVNNPPPPPVKLLHEMNVQTYNGLLRLQKPGCRTLIVLVDTETKSAITREFAKAVYPYRNHKTLMFGYLNLDKYMHWYIQLLRTTDSCRGRPLNLDLKNCLGTVLVLNNFKHCFSVFHANVTKLKTQDEEDYYGLSSSSESGESDVEAGVHRRRGKREKARENSLPGNGHSQTGPAKECWLNGLPTFLERVFDGQIPRIEVDSWPKLTT